ncbi:P-loop NTPase fold protein [Streptomyces sp. ACA25]|uniref:P-loop NTPase fold protein n=1 Tax=Streptomyces sp. ACA25 TaxID=3022596 RepID=UPI002307EE1F|nr:P-loop NTPase fold protein [Streptomyces sp. ACA25]MDB1089449.1 P-loop NTPase fold protein [Streptomyces sp. ACA25]
MCRWPVRDFSTTTPWRAAVSAPDLLGRERYARHAITLLGQVRTQSESGVLGLIGPWGSGKSSVLKMMLARLATESGRDTGWLVVELNPWLYTDLDSLVLALFSEIRAALPRGRRWSEARKQIGEFGEAISPLGKATALLGLDSEGVIKQFSRRLSGEASASAARHRVEKALRKTDRPILVVMDDVDRLTTDELLVLFKLVRLVGRLPHVYYVLSFDEQTLLDVLQRSDLVRDDDVYRAREFLEKIVQVRLDLPAFRDRERAALVERVMNTLLESHGLALNTLQERRFADAYAWHLRDRLATPRAIKRLFAQAQAALPELVGQVDVVDFLVVTFLRTSEQGIYRMLGRYREELTGTSFERSLRRTPQEEREELWLGRLRDAHVSEENLRGVLRLLAMLFPEGQLSAGRGAHHMNAAQRRGIGSGDYFDRYSVFGVPDDDLPEEAFDRGLRQLATGQHGEEASALLRWLERDTHRFARRVQQRRETGGPIPAAPLLVAIAERCGQLTSEREGWLNAQASLGFAARELLTDLPPEQRPDVVDSMAATMDGAVLVGFTLHEVTSGDDNRPVEAEDGTTEEWVIEARALLARRLSHHLSPAEARGPSGLTETDVSAIWVWRHTDPPGARSWIRQRLDSSWDLLPLLARLIPRMHGPWPLIDDTNLASLETLIGPDYLHGRLEAVPDPPADARTHEDKILQALRHRARTERSRQTTEDHETGYEQ